jgi:hypothetical protein
MTAGLNKRMVQIAEFEEKTYESYFGQEVTRIVRNSFSPGQIDEAILGFDGSFFIPFFCRNIHFSRLFPRWLGHFPGIILSDIDYLIDELDRDLPRCRLNLFVQYKRPEYVFGHRAAEWNCWQRPYFRYALTNHQQLALERLEQKSNGRAAVIYASPAFWESSDLYKRAAAGHVVAGSNIARVSAMAGHSRFTYTDPGASGIAHSEPERVNGPSLEEILNRGLENEKLRLTDHIIATSKAIQSVFDNDETGMQLMGSATAAVLYRSGLADDSLRGQFVKALATIEAFTNVANVQVYLT